MLSIFPYASFPSVFATFWVRYLITSFAQRNKCTTLKQDVNKKTNSSCVCWRGRELGRKKEFFVIFGLIFLKTQSGHKNKVYK